MALVCTMALSLGACATSINQVMTDPSHYRNQQAKISGRVVDSYALGPQGAYLIDDRTGQIWVVSDRGVPRRGAWVTVYGRVREGFSLGMLGDRVRLPRGVGSGVVLIEDHHRAQF
jgi:hypothetical protein